MAKGVPKMLSSLSATPSPSPSHWATYTRLFRYLLSPPTRNKKKYSKARPKSKKKTKNRLASGKKKLEKKTKLQTKNYKQQKVIKVEFRLGSPVELINLLYPLPRKNAKAEKHFSCPVSQLDLRIFKNSITYGRGRGGGWLSRDLECELKTFFRSEYLKILLLKLSRVLNPTKSPWNHLAD